ncbi:hypothetical protein ABK040_009559 [Willaertia magna]
MENNIPNYKLFCNSERNNQRNTYTPANCNVNYNVPYDHDPMGHLLLDEDEFDNQNISVHHPEDLTFHELTSKDEYNLLSNSVLDVSALLKCNGIMQANTSSSFQPTRSNDVPLATSIYYSNQPYLLSNPMNNSSGLTRSSNNYLNQQHHHSHQPSNITNTTTVNNNVVNHQVNHQGTSSRLSPTSSISNPSIDSTSTTNSSNSNNNSNIHNSNHYINQSEQQETSYKPNRIKNLTSISSLDKSIRPTIAMKQPRTRVLNNMPQSNSTNNTNEQQEDEEVSSSSEEESEGNVSGDNYESDGEERRITNNNKLSNGNNNPSFQENKQQKVITKSLESTEKTSKKRNTKKNEENEKPNKNNKKVGNNSTKLETTSSSTSPINNNTTITANNNDSQQKYSFREAGILVLKQLGQPSNAQTITDEIFKQNLVQSSGKTPERTVAAMMYQEIKKKRNQSAFAMFGQGIFGLAEWKKQQENSTTIALKENKESNKAKLPDIQVIGSTNNGDIANDNNDDIAASNDRSSNATPTTPIITDNNNNNSTGLIGSEEKETKKSSKKKRRGKTKRNDKKRKDEEEEESCSLAKHRSRRKTKKPSSIYSSSEEEEEEDNTDYNSNDETTTTNKRKKKKGNTTSENDYSTLYQNYCSNLKVLEGNRPSEDECFVCKNVGDLICCDFHGCTKVYHLACVGLSSVPEGNWVCPYHSCSECKCKFITKKCFTCPYCVCDEHINLLTDRIDCEKFICKKCKQYYVNEDK